MARVRILLDVEGEEADALYVVNELLDAGVLQEDINDHDFDAGKLRVKMALAELEVEPEVVNDGLRRNERGVPLTTWPRLRDHDVALVASYVGARLAAMRSNGSSMVLHMFTDRQLEIELVDNGGEVRVLRVERTEFGPDVPLTRSGFAIGPCTLAYRIRATILGEPIDYEKDLDRG